MASMDRRTGKLIDQAATLRQSIEMALSAPVGGLMFHRDRGYACLEKEGLTREVCEDKARQTLADFHDIALQSIEAKINDRGKLVELSVDYLRKFDGQQDSVTIQY